MAARDRVSIEWEDTDEGRTVVIAGEIDLSTVASLRRCLEEPIPAGTLVVDLRGVTFMDSEGLRFLFDARKQATNGFRLFTSERVQRLIDLTDTAKFFHAS